MCLNSFAQLVHLSTVQFKRVSIVPKSQCKSIPIHAHQGNHVVKDARMFGKLCVLSQRLDGSSVPGLDSLAQVLVEYPHSFTSNLASNAWNTRTIEKDCQRVLDGLSTYFPVLHISRQEGRQDPQNLSLLLVVRVLQGGKTIFKQPGCHVVEVFSPLLFGALVPALQKLSLDEVVQRHWLAGEEQPTLGKTFDLSLAETTIL